MGASTAVVCCVSVSGAQTVTGTVTGMVSDPSGAVIAGARIVAHNVDTGVDSPAKSDGAGLYRIAYLPIGRYTVAVTANGFNEQDIPPSRWRLSRRRRST